MGKRLRVVKGAGHEASEPRFDKCEGGASMKIGRWSERDSFIWH